MTAAITTHELRRSFGDNVAVDGVDLSVEPGEIYGFLGPNGAGKSTTVKMLCTLLTPTSGTATVAGFDVATQASDIRLRIGVALQESSIDGKQTGRELLHLQGRLYGLSKKNITQRMDEVIGLVNIGDAIDDRVESYSGGMKRRLDLDETEQEWVESYFHDKMLPFVQPVLLVKDMVRPFLNNAQLFLTPHRWRPLYEKTRSAVGIFPSSVGEKWRNSTPSTCA